MCSMTGKSGAGKRLVEDHCHESGMVRALLCASCNSFDGKSSERIWEAYRKYAPANGWYYRYHKFGQQWMEWSDPLSTRIKLKDIGLDKETFELMRMDDLVCYYIEKTANLEPTKITKECEQLSLGSSFPISEEEAEKEKEAMRIAMRNIL